MLKYQKQKPTFKSFLQALTTRIDFFGNKPTFRIMKKQQYSTPVGVGFSLTIVFICMIFFIVQLDELLNRTNPSVLMTEQSSIDTPPFTLDITNTTLAFSLVSLNLTQIHPAKSYYTMKFSNCQRRRLIDANSKHVQILTNCTDYELEPCSQLHMRNPVSQDLFSRLNVESLNCINSKQWASQPPKLQGSVTSMDFSYIQIRVFPCKNTSVSSPCASPEAIRRVLEKGYYNYYLWDSLIQMDRQQGSFQDLAKQAYTTFSLSKPKTLHTEVRVTEAQTDTGLLTSEVTSEFKLIQSGENESYEDSAENGEDEFFVYHALHLTNRKLIYTRKYPKIQQILGSIGGLWQMLFLVFSIAIQPFQIFFMNMEMVNRLFSFEQEEEHEKLDPPTVFNRVSNSKCLEPSCFGHRDLLFSCNPNDLIKSDINIFSNQVNSPYQFQQIVTLFKSVISRYKESQLASKIKKQILILIGCDRKAREKLNYATEKFMQKLDVTYMIQKFYELEKLKLILLTHDQMNLFHFMQKPLIPKEVFSKDDHQEIFKKIEQKHRCKLIFEEEKSLTVKFSMAYNAYKNIKMSNNHSYTDSQLLGMIDLEIINLFEQVLHNQNKDSALKSPALVTDSKRVLSQEEWQIQDEQINVHSLR